MSTTVKYDGFSCASGVVVPFSGISLPLRQNYKIEFSCTSRMPESTYAISPTGFYLFPSEKNLTLTTVFAAKNRYTLYNSSSNIIRLSIYNSDNSEIYRDYAAVYCGNLSADPAQPTVTPTPSLTVTPTMTVTPSITPTITLTPTNTITPTPSKTPPIGFSASFDSLLQDVGNCGQIVVRGIATGKIGYTYNYYFSTDMSGVDMNISNPSGTITITSNPTYIQTEIFVGVPCHHYSLKFGLSNGSTAVESLAFFRCGQCP